MLIECFYFWYHVDFFMHICTIYSIKNTPTAMHMNSVQLGLQKGEEISQFCKGAKKNHFPGIQDVLI